MFVATGVSARIEQCLSESKNKMFEHGSQLLRVITCLGACLLFSGCAKPTHIEYFKIAESSHPDTFKTKISTEGLLSCDVVLGFKGETIEKNQTVKITITSKSESIQHTANLATAEAANWLSSQGLNALIAYSLSRTKLDSGDIVDIEVVMLSPDENVSVWIVYTHRGILRKKIQR